MRIIPQIHQYDKDYPGHLPSDEDLGIVAISPKTHDGTSWMGDFDTHPKAIRDLSTYQDRVRDYEARGIEVIPWCVPTGVAPGREAEIAALVGSVTGQLILDVELDADRRYFWVGGEPAIDPYLTELRRRFKGNLILQYDSRWPGNIHLPKWLPYVDAVLSMDYWTDFRRDALDVLNDAGEAMVKTRKPFMFTLPANSSHFPDYPYGEDVYLWKRGSMSPAAVQFCQENRPPLVTPIGTEKPLAEKVDDLYRELTRQQVQFEEWKAAVEDRFAQLKGVVSTWS